AQVHQTKDRFFFRAEDGIRDLTVTGVQTCALPILRFFPIGSRGSVWRSSPFPSWRRSSRRRAAAAATARATTSSTRRTTPCCPQIGRASCRERVECSVAGELGQHEQYSCESFL